MKGYFFRLVSELNLILPKDFFFTATFSGESSDFVRFNQGKVVQAGSVSQNCFNADIICGKKHSTVSLSISGQMEEDKKSIEQLVKRVVENIDSFEEDPFLLYSTYFGSSEQTVDAKLPPASEITSSIVDAAQGLDFVGIHAQGVIRRGFANSLGQRNFIEQETFNTDFSVYHSTDKAIKANLAGRDWDSNALIRKLDSIRSYLEILKRPAKTIEKGRYRAFLAPAAVDEIFSLLKYGGFSEKQGKTKQSPLMLLREAKREFHSSVCITENTQDGFGAPFQSGGFMKPNQVQLIHEGKWGSGLISPRTAKEYDLSTNGANQSESPESIEMKPGALRSEDILSALGTGLLINNLWYLNYSDRTNGRMTGMTRFATFWVENGEIVAPVNVMRFDDSIFNILGSSLEAITQEREFILDQSTYEERSTNSTHLPGILLSDISFTL